MIQRLEAKKSDPPFSLVADLVRILGISLENAVFNQRVAKQVERAQEAQHEDS